MTEKKKIMDSPAYMGPDPKALFPIRSEVKWYQRGDIVVLEYPKNLTRMEKRINKLIKGPENIKRPLDEVGTLLWKLSDGEHSLLDIYMEEQETFHERVEPLDKVVGSLLETLLKLGLLRLDYRPDGKKSAKRVKKAKKVILRSPE
jgi:hypothetical protein